MYITGPGHGGPGIVANTYLEGTYSQIYSDVTQDTEDTPAGRDAVALARVLTLSSAEREELAETLVALDDLETVLGDGGRPEPC